jgi:hypothetical protein
VGYRPFPSLEELVAGLRGQSVRLRALPPAEGIEYPALVTAPWCPFTVPASRFWEAAAEATGRTLQVVDAESDEGARVISALGLAGVPCVVATPGRSYYGYQLSPADARDFLSEAAEPPASPMP